MLDLLAKITAEGETFHITYVRLAGGHVRLLVQPCLKDDPDMVTDDNAQQARAALSRPMVITGTHAEVAAAFTRYVDNSRDARSTLKDAYDALTDNTKQEAKKAAQAAANKTQSSGGADKKHTKASEDSSGNSAKATTSDASDTAVTTADDGTQPDSLFD